MNTLELKKINISFCLIVLIFYFLLFMGPPEFGYEEPLEEEAYENFCGDLECLLNNLLKLRTGIDKCKTNHTEAPDERIENLIQMVESAQMHLKNNVPNGMIEKSISILSQVCEVQSSLFCFSKQNSYSSDELWVLLNKVEEIWKEQIQKKITEAILSTRSVYMINKSARILRRNVGNQLIDRDP